MAHYEKRGGGTQRAEAELYKNKLAAQKEAYDKVETGSVQCAYKGCSKLPDTVCEECVQYVCNEHLYRHPDCDEGK